MLRRSRYLIPSGTPGRAELVGALSVAALLAHLLLAQLTLALTTAFWATGKVSRWRPHWLAIPAAAGLIWTLAIGPGRAAAGLAAGPGQVARYLTGAAASPGRLLHLSRAFAGLIHWLPRQLPLALIAAAAEAAWLSWLRWLHTGSQDLPPARPGLVVTARRRHLAASIRSGGVVTRDGGCLGLDDATGRRAAISWPEAEGGVLCGGPDPSALAETGFQLAHAAIRRRKTVITIDLTGSRQLADSMAGVCAAAQAPLRIFGEAGPGCYEPVRGGDPARGASLVLGMIDWTGVSDQHRRTCAAYLNDAFAVLAAAPADPRLPVLDDIFGLLEPAALRARAARVAARHPRREILADRASVSARLLEADPAAVSALAAQLPRLRGSALGHWLRPAQGPVPHRTGTEPSRYRAGGGAEAEPSRYRAGGGAEAEPWRHQARDMAATGSSFGGGRHPGELAISLGHAVRDRAVVLFSLDRSVHGRSARMIASLAVADLIAIVADLHGMAVRGDSLVWVNGCEMLEGQLAAGLIRQAAGTGTAVLLTTTSAATAAGLAAEAGVIVIRGPADPALAGRVAALAGAVCPPPATGMRAGVAGQAGTAALKMRDSSDLLAESLLHQGPDSFALLVQRPRRRLVPFCLAVPSAAGGSA
jgi:hypothetical protein